MESARGRVPAVAGIEDLVEIGRGGAGVVYRGVQVGLARTVAVKVVRAAGTPEAALRRWRREVTAMARLSSQPNIVAVFDGGVTESGLPYLVMPFVTGGSLEGRLSAGGPMAGPEVVALGRQLASALTAAHAAGVLHRDVKPANVLLGSDGEPQLADFGIAQLADATATMTVGVHATIAYAAPEVLSGLPASTASDVYGLAATLVACLTGRPPHEVRPGEAMVSHALRVVADPPVDLRAAGVEPALADVLEQAMAKDPATRTQTAADFEADLAALSGAAGSSGSGASTVVLAPPRLTTTVPATAPVTTAGPPVDTTGSPGAGTPTGRGRVIPALLLMLGGLAALLVVTLTRGEDDPGAATDGRSATTTAESAEEAGSAPVATAVPAPPSGGDLRAVATGYIAALQSGDFEAAYAMTTAGFQAAQPFDGYVAFWGGFAEIAIEGEPEVDEATATVTLRLRLDGSTEAYSLELAETADGSLLVDGPRPR